jgi:hypothetical protein
VFYFNNDNQVVGFDNGQESTEAFISSLSSLNLEGASNSSLSAVFHSPGSLNSSLIIVWQKVDGSVWLQNGTTIGNTYQLPVNATSGSSLSLIQLRSIADYGELRLFYTTSSPNGTYSLAATSWTSNDHPQSGWSSGKFSEDI